MSPYKKESNSSVVTDFQDILWESFTINGYIKVSTNLARNGQALYGSGVVGATDYVLSDVVCRFITVPDDGKQAPMLMNSCIGVKSSINSQVSNIVARVPSQAVNGVVISFINQANENDITKNSYKLEKMPLIDEIQYLFADSTNKYITYVMNDPSDMQKKGLDAKFFVGKKEGVSLAIYLFDKINER